MNNLAPTSQPVRRNLVILIEPDPAVRAVVRRMVEGLSYRVIEAAQLGEGLDAIKAHQTALAAVVFDLPRAESAVHPSLSAIQQESPGVPIVLTSAGCFVPDGAKPNTPSAVSFLAKPYARRDLMAVLLGL